MAWDISGCEWGAVTGYDEEKQILYTLKIDGSEGSIPFRKLGQLEMPILSVLTVAGKRDKSIDDIVADTKRIALSHLRGEEWSDNAKGLAAYDTLIGFVRDKLTADTAWNLEYYLGTYAALKWYAWKFFERHGEIKLAGLYKRVFDCWQQAFDRKRSGDVLKEQTRNEIAEFLQDAWQAEKEAVEVMGEFTAIAAK